LLKASNDYKTLTNFAEQSLTKLGFSFIKNGTELLTEFEINDPYFRVVIEPSKVPRMHKFPVYSLAASKGSTVEIRFRLNAQDQELKMATEKARHFIQSLIQDLPVKPWVGLGGFFNREEKKWIDFH
jgi:hypothetical protein